MGNTVPGKPRKGLDRDLTRDQHILRIFNDFTVELISISTEEALAWYVAREVVGKMGFDDCVVYYVNNTSNSLWQCAAIGESKNPRSNDIIDALEIPIGKGVTGSVAQTKKPLIVDDLKKDDRYIADVDEARSEICVPLLIDDRVVGVIDCEDPKIACFDSDDLELLTTIASLMSAKLKSISLAQELFNQTEMLQQAEEVSLLGHWKWDAEGDRLESCSEQMAKLFGATVPELLDQFTTHEAFLAFVHPDDRDFVDTTVRSYSRLFQEKSGPEKSLDIEYRILKRDGTTTHVREIGRHEIDEHGQRVRSVGTIQDITERKQLNEQVLTRDAWLTAIFENSPIEIVLKDTDGRIVAISDNVPSTLGFERDDFIGRTAADFLPDHIADIYMAADRKVVETGEPLQREIVEEVDGVVRYSLSQKFPLRGEDGVITGICSLTTDFTEMKLAQEALHANERQLHTAAKLARLGYSVWDTRTDRCSFCSEEYAKMHGVSVDEFIQDSSTLDGPFAFTHPDDKDEYRLACEGAANGKGYDMEYRIIKPGGEVRWLHETSTPVFDKKGITIEEQVIAQDITKRKRTEEALREAYDNLEERVAERTTELSREIQQRIDAEAMLRSSEESYRVLAALSPAGIYRTDAEGNVTYVNEKWCELGDLTFDEAVGDGWLNGLHPDDVAETVGLWNISASEKKMYQHEQRYRRKDGEVTFCLSQSMPEFDDDGKVVGHVGVIIDITEQKRAEQQLEAAKDNAQAANQAKSEFLSTMSHELRTPLTSILGSLGMLNSVFSSDFQDESKNLVEMALRNSVSLLGLVNELLDYEKILSGELEFELRRYNICEQVSASVENCRGFGRKHSVDFVFEDPLAPLYAETHETRFEQVLNNLLSNAAKFSKSGDEVDVSIESDNGNIIVKVKDYGVGIPEEFRSVIFDRFTQVDSSSSRKHSGTGLGLPISKALVEAMGGTLEFETELDVGSTFSVVLPVLK